MVLLWAALETSERYEITFSYRSTERYEKEMDSFAPSGLIRMPIRLTPSHRATARDANEGSGPARAGFVSQARSGMDLLMRYPRFCQDVARLVRVFRQVRPDIVHLNNGGFPGARSVRAGAVAARLSGCPTVIMAVNNTAIRYSTIGRRCDYPADLLTRWATDMFVTASKQARMALIDVLGLEESHVTQIPNAVRDPRELAGLDEGPRPDLPGAITIIMVAGLEARKGHITLLQALEQLKASGDLSEPAVQVWLVGEGPERAALESRVLDSGLEHVVQFLGYRYDYLRLISRSNIMVLSSVDLEDSPLATIEGMSLAIPVIASDVAGLGEQIVDGETGYLVPPRNPSALADRIRLLLHDATARKTMGEAGRRRFLAEYQPTAFVRRYLDLYDRCSHSGIR